MTPAAPAKAVLPAGVVQMASRGGPEPDARDPRAPDRDRPSTRSGRSPPSERMAGTASAARTARTARGSPARITNCGWRLRVSTMAK